MDSLATFHCFIISLISQPIKSFAYASNEETVNLYTVGRYDLEVDCGNWDILPEKYMYIYINTLPLTQSSKCVQELYLCMRVPHF